MPARHPVKHIFIAIKLAYFFTILFGFVGTFCVLTMAWESKILNFVQKTYFFDKLKSLSSISLHKGTFSLLIKSI